MLRFSQWFSSECNRVSYVRCIVVHAFCSQHFVLGKEKREGDTVTSQGKKFLTPHHRCGIQQLYVLHQSDIQRAPVCAINEGLRQNHFICHDFRLKTKLQISSLPLAKF
jgi:hypothetical protein